MIVPRDPVTAPPTSDDDVAAWTASLGVDGLTDLHVHFLPDRVLQKVWSYFDNACEHYGRAWPIHYKEPEDVRLALLRALGVTTFAPLVYPHKADMAAWLTSWALDWAAQVPEALPTATIYPEPSVASYLGDAVTAGAQVVKVHVQVGGYDPRDPLLDPAWGLLADAGVPVMAHCGNGPIPGSFTGLDVFGEVLEAHPRLTVILAHAGLPDYAGALSLVERYERVYLDTTMVGTDYTEEFAPLPADWPARLVDVADRVVLGTDFPNIPYAYWRQLAAVCGWAAADDRLGADFLRRVVRDTPDRLIAARV